MAKLQLNNLASLENQTSALGTINDNNDKIEQALDNTISRDGSTPNSMQADIDMDGNRVTGLGAPQADTDAARWMDVSAAIDVQGVLVPAPEDGKFLKASGSTFVWDTPGGGGLVAANNLSDLPSPSTARNSLQLGSVATYNVGVAGSTIPRCDQGHTWSEDQLWQGYQYFADGASFYGTKEVTFAYNVSSLSEYSAGFRGAPSNVQDATYTPNLNDAGKMLLHTSASPHTWTVPTNGSVPFPLGTAIVVVNTGAGAVTLARGSGVSLQIAGSATNSDKTLAQHGLATLLKVGLDQWFIMGVGVS